MFVLNFQARHDSLRPAPSVPIPPKQQQSRKDAGVADQSNAGETHSVNKTKKDAQVSVLPPANPVQKSSVPLTGISMAMPYHHQSQASVFGGPSPQIQSQGMPAASLQMPIPMPLPIGNAAQVQQQVFVPGLQPLIHPQGIMHQSQNMSFNPHMGPQLPHQLGNMGINMNPQYPQQQGGKFAGPRKTTSVKITHPETHEELRLDFDKKADSSYSDIVSSSAKSYSDVTSQNQPVKSFAPSHPINYYPSSSYSGSSIYFPPPSSVPLSSSHITPNSQQPRFNYSVNHGPQNVGFNNQLAIGSLSSNKTGTSVPSIFEPSNLEPSRDVHKVIPSTTAVVTPANIKPSGGSAILDSSLSNSSVPGVKMAPSSLWVPGDVSSSVPEKGSGSCSEVSSHESKSTKDSSVSLSLPKPAAVSAEKLTTLPTPSAAASENSVSAVSSNEGRKKESLSRSNSLKDNQKKAGKRGQSQNPVFKCFTTYFYYPSGV